MSLLAELSKAYYSSVSLLHKELFIGGSQNDWRLHQATTCLDLLVERLSVFFFPDVPLYFSLWKLLFSMFESNIGRVKPQLVKGYLLERSLGPPPPNGNLHFWPHCCQPSNG